MGYWIFIFIFSFRFANSLCPNDVENSLHTLIHTCDQSDNLIKRQRYVDGELYDVDHFKPLEKRPFKRDVYVSKYADPYSYEFTYLKKESGDFRLTKTNIYSLNGDFIGSHKTEVDMSEVEFVYKKPKALIIDSGFNWTHKDLVSKIHYNQNEVLNGLDDDGDGLIDNITSLNGTTGRGGSVDYKSNIQQVLQLPTHDAPLSHGGFVASVAMKNIDHYSFIGVGGDIYSPVYLYKMLDLINRNELKFANMSFGFGDQKSPIIIDSDSFEAISGIVTASMNTLFVVAAGNGSKNFDETTYSEYPACYQFHNMITVGALDTDEIIQKDLDTYEVASFSNVGERCVDLYAPGVGVEGAGLADTYMKASGTSVSSPYVMNLLLKMHEINESLNIYELKKILMDTAHIPKSGPLKARSGGIVNPKAALDAVRKTL